MSRTPFDRRTLEETAFAYWGSCALFAAVQTGLSARLARGPAGRERLARELELDRRGLELLLVALQALGVVQEQDGRWSLSPGASALFTPGGSRDQSHVLLHLGDMVADWARLAECVRRGRPVERPQAKEDEPSPPRTHFYRAMRDIARQQAPGLARRLGLRGGQHLLDLGGGPGVYALTFVQETPGLAATVFDLPQAEEHFRQERERYPGGEAVVFRAGDYRRHELGGPYQVVWISQVLHGAGPRECAQLVAKAARALAPGGVLWIQEFVLDPQGRPERFAALFGLNMLVNTEAGRSYRREELAGFMRGAGLAEVEYVGPTVEGSAAGLMRGVKPGN